MSGGFPRTYRKSLAGEVSGALKRTVTVSVGQGQGTSGSTDVGVRFASSLLGCISSLSSSRRAWCRLRFLADYAIWSRDECVICMEPLLGRDDQQKLRKLLRKCPEKSVAGEVWGGGSLGRASVL